MSKFQLKMLHLGIAVSLAVSLFCLFFFLRQDFTAKGWSDAFFLSGAVVSGFGGLAFIAGKGVFDMMGYAMYRVVGAFKFRGQLRYNDAISFKEDRNLKRVKYPFFSLGYILVGAALILLAVIFMLVYFATR